MSAVLGRLTADPWRLIAVACRGLVVLAVFLILADGGWSPPGL